jgi:hypothetical protein
MPATTSFRLASDGSVVMNVIGGGTPHEMVTMFHLDNNDLLATHYCAAHNQPRFRLARSCEPNVMTIDFKDATNLPSPVTPHMVNLKITFLDASHHYEDWTYLKKGQKEHLAVRLSPEGPRGRRRARPASAFMAPSR